MCIVSVRYCVLQSQLLIELLAAVINPCCDSSCLTAGYAVRAGDCYACISCNMHN